MVGDDVEVALDRVGREDHPAPVRRDDVRRVVGVVEVPLPCQGARRGGAVGQDARQLHRSRARVVDVGQPVAAAVMGVRGELERGLEHHVTAVCRRAVDRREAVVRLDREGRQRRGGLLTQRARGHQREGRSAAVAQPGVLVQVGDLRDERVVGERRGGLQDAPRQVRGEQQVHRLERRGAERHGKRILRRADALRRPSVRAGIRAPGALGEVVDRNARAGDVSEADERGERDGASVRRGPCALGVHQHVAATLRRRRDHLVRASVGELLRRGIDGSDQRHGRRHCQRDLPESPDLPVHHAASPVRGFEA